MGFDYVALGARVKRLRESRGWTQANLAEHCGISDSHISSIERGFTECSVGKLVQLANTFRVPADALVYDEIYASDIRYKRINDIAADCSSQELKVLADSMEAIKGSLRKNGIEKGAAPAAE